MESWEVDSSKRAAGFFQLSFIMSLQKTVTKQDDVIKRARVKPQIVQNDVERGIHTEYPYHFTHI